MMKTAEAVTPSHPDKICDQISDAVLDACLEQDPMSRVAIETMGGHGIITITGELTTNAYVDIREIAQGVYRKCGYKEKVGVQVNVVSQSNEISRGVDTGGAGDQGIMIGYACDENVAMIPQELYLARSLAQFIYDEHKQDGKTQITLNGDKIDTVVASFANVNSQTLMMMVSGWLVKSGYNVAEHVHVNPAGDWSIGGFEADTGVTGRKLAVDNYGTRIQVGGGAFSGKDSTKVDRSGAYIARRIAVDILRKNFAKVVKVEIAYAIGVAQPVMATAVIVFQDGKIEELDLLKDSDYDLTPNGIIESLDLRKPQFEQSARWGHFGNGFAWDK